jgi:hypothetical protein
MKVKPMTDHRQSALLAMLTHFQAEKDREVCSSVADMHELGISTPETLGSYLVEIGATTCFNNVAYLPIVEVKSLLASIFAIDMGEPDLGILPDPLYAEIHYDGRVLHFSLYLEVKALDYTDPMCLVIQDKVIDFDSWVALDCFADFLTEVATLAYDVLLRLNARRKIEVEIVEVE